MTLIWQIRRAQFAALRNPHRNRDIFSFLWLPHTKNQRQSLQPWFSSCQHILHCGASLDAAHMLYGAVYPCTILPLPKNQHSCSKKAKSRRLFFKYHQSSDHGAGRPIYIYRQKLGLGQVFSISVFMERVCFLSKWTELGGETRFWLFGWCLQEIMLKFRKKQLF